MPIVHLLQSSLKDTSWSDPFISKITNRDTITDFNQHDKIDLSAIDANTAVTGNNAFASLKAGDHFLGSFAKPASLLSQNASSKLCTLVQGFSCYTNMTDEMIQEYLEHHQRSSSTDTGSIIFEGFGTFSPGATYALSVHSGGVFDQTTHTLYGNNDSDSAADFSILLTGITSLATNDFIV